MAKRIIITGCSTGIGRALAVELVARGHHVISTARKASTITGLGDLQLSLDVASDQSVQAAAAAAGPVDVVVNNAGLGIWSPVEMVTLEQANALFQVNFFGALRMQRAFLPGMRALGGGQIIQISSAAGRVSGPLIGHYAASKAALEAMSAALRLELAPFGIKVAIIELGAVETEFGSNRIPGGSDPSYTSVIEHFTAKLLAMRQTPASAASCAAVIADTIESGARDLLVEATADAASLPAARRSKSDAAWEAELLAGLSPQ